MRRNRSTKINSALLAQTAVLALCLASLCACAGPLASTSTTVPASTSTSLPASTITPKPEPTLTPKPTIASKPTLSVLISLDYAALDATITQAMLSKDGQFIGVQTAQGQVDVWAVESGQTWSVELPSDEFAFALGSGQGHGYIAVFAPNASGEVALWQVKPGAAEAVLLATVSEPAYLVTAAEFSYDGQTLAVGYSAGEIRLFNSEDGTQLRAIQAHADWVTLLSFSPDGHSLLSDSLSADPNTLVHDFKTGELLATLDQTSYDPIWGFFSPDGKLVAMHTMEETRVFDTEAWQPIGQIPIPIMGLMAKDQTEVFVLPQEAVTETFPLENGLQVLTYYPSLLFLPDGRTLLLEVDTDAGQISLQVVASR